MADPWAGDDAWSVGCRAYSFSRSRLRQAANGGRYPWLGVLDETHHFVFLIDGVPVRFFRGDAAEPSKRTLRQQESEAQQLALALGDTGVSEGLMFRLAVETGEDGNVARVVFLALRGEEGVVETFWPVPLEAGADVRAGAKRPNSTPSLQLPLASTAKGERSSSRRSAGTARGDAPA